MRVYEYGYGQTNLRILNLEIYIFVIFKTFLKICLTILMHLMHTYMIAALFSI